MNLQERKQRDWWRIGDCAVLLAYVCVVSWTIRYHEKWADEAQAWLIARDLDLRTIWFHELRYEGSPGLWHTILWVAQHVFHLGYGAIGYIGLVFAIAGAAVLIFLAPFPRIVRWPLAFTYVMVYQYAVISRPYTMLPLLAFCAAILFKDLEHPERLTVVLILLAMLTIHGTILAGCLGLAYLTEAMKSWFALENSVKRRYMLCAVVLGLSFAFVFLILKPTPDVGEFAVQRAIKELPQSVQEQQPTPLHKAEAVVSGAFLDYTIPSVIFIGLTAWWCSTRRRLLEFGLPILLLVALYSFVHGYPHHHGTVCIAAITAFWIAWPTFREQAQFSIQSVWATRGMVALLLCLCAVNIMDAAVVIHREYLYPYSGAHDAANYLKAVGADRGPIFGFLFGTNAVQAYFERNIMANMSTAYYHNGLPLEGISLDVDALHRVKPRYIIAYSAEPQLMMDTGVPLLVAEGYELVHFSDGYYLYKRAVYQRETYFIFRRSAGNARDLPPGPGAEQESPRK